MFASDQDVENLVAAELHKLGFPALPQLWTPLAQRAHQRAYQEIYMALVRRGWTPAQIAAWDLGPAFELSLSCFWALVMGGMQHKADPTFIRTLDVRKALETVEVSNGGVWQIPGNLPPGGPGQAYAGQQQIHQNFRFEPCCGQRSCGQYGESCNTWGDGW